MSRRGRGCFFIVGLMLNASVFAEALDDTDTTAAPPPADSAMTERRQLWRDFSISPLRPSYILHTYSSSPNQDTYRLAEPDATLKRQELQYQLSFRLTIDRNWLGSGGDLWFGYTQMSFWQAYNKGLSSPFRETNYQPELDVSFDIDSKPFGLNLVSVGVVHQSNGRSKPLSRSWNRLWASATFEHGKFVTTITPWLRLPEGDDDNPDIENYVGRGEIRLIHKDENRVFSAMLRNNFDRHDNRSGVELSWSFPYHDRLKWLVQYYNGYGESLVDYNVRMRRIGIGVLITDWL